MLRVGRKSGFTLIELLIVVCIIGLLTAVLVTSFSGASESARAASCKANLHNLAQAAFTYANDEGSYPRAESFEYSYVKKDGTRMFRELRGWVAWTGRSGGHADSRSAGAGCSRSTCFATTKNYGKEDPAYLSIVEGALWKYVADLKVFCCGTFKSVCQSQGYTALRSYKMNPYFGISSSGLGDVPDPDVRTRDLSARGDAGMLLLFAEIPCYQPGTRNPQVSNDNGGQATDSFVHTDIKGYNAKIYAGRGSSYAGFNHRVGKRNVGHFVFADGHVEAVPEPKGANLDDLRELTKYYCNGWELEEDLLKRIR